MREIIQVIQHIEVFHGLNEAQLARVAAIIQQESYGSGDMIIRQDDPGDSMYMIGQGQVEVLKRDSRGEQRTALFLGEGQVFGELALLDQGLRTATVVADNDPTLLYCLKREPFEALCHEDSALGYLMMRNLALDLAFKLRHQNLDN
ncbi:MAG: cyclic nucleotide-binding domain-containing protein [Chloroflexota bacterium]